MPTGPYRVTTCRERELTLDHIHNFLTTQGHGGSPRMRDHLNAGATSETRQTWKPIHTIKAPIHSNKADMKEWLWRPNDVWGPCGPKVPDISLTGEENPEKSSPRKLVQTGDQTWWQACMLAAQRWTIFTLIYKILKKKSYDELMNL